MRISGRVFAVPAAAALLLFLPGCDWMRKKGPPDQGRAADIAAARAQKIEQACASGSTYDRLKELAFDEAIRIRNADPVNLDTLATHSVVRMENPVVKARDESLNVTVCTGRFVLELPPGAERGFAGERRLTSDVEYAAQAAADGSGLVYQLKGAEPIIYKLAAFDLRGAKFRAPPAETQVAAAPSVQPRPPVVAAEPAEPPSAEAQPVPQRAKQDSRPPVARPPVARPPAPRAGGEQQVAERRAGSARPSFNCRYAKSRSEQMVCANERLASLDRRMSSLYYSALSDAEGPERSELRRTRDRFLSYRERCRTEACVADAYQGRMEEIRDIVPDP